MQNLETRIIKKKKKKTKQIIKLKQEQDKNQKLKEVIRILCMYMQQSEISDNNGSRNRIKLQSSSFLSLTLN